MNYEVQWRGDWRREVKWNSKWMTPTYGPWEYIPRGVA